MLLESMPELSHIPDACDFNCRIVGKLLQGATLG